MSAVADSRKKVLERIRAATAAGSAGRNSGAAAEKAAETHIEVPREYQRQGNMTVSARHERFIERLREYDAEVVECEPDGLVATIAARLGASGRRTFVAPEGLPEEWRAPGFEWKIDGNLEVRDVEQADGVVTGCFCGVADSGTIVLHHGPAEGRRVISLLPDWHLCVVRASQVVETLPEYFDRCREQGSGNSHPSEQSPFAGDPGREQGAETLPRLVTWIAGPSATADIEMTRIKGVHGPRFLNVILVMDY
jgi:L-lactate dehydrogenase complex protein LldG